MEGTSPDRFGYYRDAQRDMDERKAIAEHQDDHAFNERFHHPSHLMTQVKLEHGQPYDPVSEYHDGSSSTHSSLHYDVHHDGSRFMSPSEYAYLEHQDGRHSRGQVDSADMFDRERAPSPGTAMHYIYRGDSDEMYDQEETEEHRIWEDMDRCTLSDGMDDEYETEYYPHAPQNSGFADYFLDGRPYPENTPRMSHTARSVYQSPSFSDATEGVDDQGQVLYGDPEEIAEMMYQVRKHRPVRSRTGSQTHTYDQGSDSSGSETVMEEYTPRSTRADRRSGVWPTNAMPKVTPRKHVSKAYLLKHGLRVGKKGRNVCKKSAGANDPHNIEIVNLKDQYNLGWRDIAQAMNEKFIREGGNRPKFTTDAVTGRYCRNAPVLYSSVGMEFIPLSERRRKGQPAIPKIDWTAESDVELVKAFKNYESKKWETIAWQLEEATGMEVHAFEAARRYGAIKR